MPKFLLEASYTLEGVKGTIPGSKPTAEFQARLDAAAHCS